MSSTTIEETTTEEAIELDQLKTQVHENGQEPENEMPEDCEDEQPSPVEVKKAELGSNRKTLLPLFETLSEPEPDAKLLQQHVGQYNSLAGIYLNIFLETPLDEFGDLYREVLKVVFVAEDICSNDLLSDEDLPHSTRFELKDFFQISNKLCKQLEGLAENADDEENHHLLVSNVLSEATTKLQHELLEFRTRKPEVPEKTSLEEPEIAEAEEEEIPEVVEEKPVPNLAVRKTGTNRWLIAATVITALVSATLFIVENQLSSQVAQTEDTENIDISKLEESEHLGAAYQIDGTMFVTAEDSWNGLSKSKKRKSLKNMLKYPSRQKVKTVIVTGGNGLVFGDMSKEDAKSEPTKE